MGERTRLLIARPWPRTALLYIVREYLLSFAVSFLFFFVVFFINQILLLAEDILAKSAPFDQTLLLLIYSLPSVVAIASPFSALAGALMTSARLNSDNEIVAFSATGFSPATLYAPFLVMGALVALVSFTANDYFLPRSAGAFRRVYGELVAHSAAVELTPYSVKRYSQAVVVTGAASGGEAGNLLLFENGGSRDDTVISASRASIAIDPSGGQAIIDMKDVVEHSVREGSERKFSVSTADGLRYRFTLKEPIVGFSGSSPAEMGSRDLAANLARKRAALDERKRAAAQQSSEMRARLVDAYGSGPAEPEGNVKIQRALSAARQSESALPADRSAEIYELEYAKKFAIPAAAIFFSLLAFPLGLGTRRAGRTAGFGIALLLSTLYWGLLFVGQTLGTRSSLSPTLAMWAPNGIVMLAAVVAWIVRRAGTRRSV